MRTRLPRICFVVVGRMLHSRSRCNKIHGRAMSALWCCWAARKSMCSGGACLIDVRACLCVSVCWCLCAIWVDVSTLLRVIPTLAFQVVYSDIYFDILPNILSDIYSDMLSGMSSSMHSEIYFGRSIWHIFWHSMWHSFSQIFWHSMWHAMWHIFWQSFWPIFFWHSIWPLRSSGAHWARKVPGWGPAVLVQHRKVAGWGPAVLTELGRSPVEVQRCSDCAEGGEEIGEDLARQKWTRNRRQRWWSRRTRTIKEVEEKEEEEKQPEQWWSNLTTLTWQVGKNRLVAAGTAR